MRIKTSLLLGDLVSDDLICSGYIHHAVRYEQPGDPSSARETCGGPFKIKALDGCRVVLCSLPLSPFVMDDVQFSLG